MGTLLHARVKKRVERIEEDEDALTKVKVTPSTDKAMCTLFWDARGVIAIDFLCEQRTINAAYYSTLLQDTVKLAYCWKRRNIPIRDVAKRRCAGISPPYTHTFFTCWLVMGSTDTLKYRSEVSISIDTSETVIDKYRYFPIQDNSEKIWGNFEKILEENRKILKYVIPGTF